jgi:hypothetical protein
MIGGSRRRSRWHDGTLFCAGLATVMAPASVVLVTAVMACPAGIVGAAEPSNQGTSGADRPRHDDLHVRYADARLRLAEADLRKFVELNARHPRSVSAAHLSRLEARVRSLREQAAAVRENAHGGAGAGHKARARMAAAVADAELDGARRLAAEHPDAVPASALERLEIVADVARLRLALWEDPANLPSPFDEMQMQIDQLTDLVMDLVDWTDTPVLPQAR